MKKLAELLPKSEDRLMSILHHYTIGTGYSKYSSTLEEAWRMSVSVLSNLLIKACMNLNESIELGPDIDYSQDPIAKFGIIEAQRHRERGIDIVMFLGLLKYYRQSYLDLVMEAEFEKLQYEKYRRFIDRFYDRIELGICGEWVKTDDAQQLKDLQSNNRFMTNEKNKYLTIVESLPHVAILLDSDLRINYMNHAAVQYLGGKGVPGSEYYCALRDRYFEYQESETGKENDYLGNEALNNLFPYLSSEIMDLYKNTINQIIFQKQVKKGNEILHFEVKISKMLDISEKFVGCVVIMNDITQRKQAEEQKDRLVLELQKAPFEVKTLSGLLPICSHCKKIRDDKGYWNSIESYIHEQSEAEFSHSICQECAKKYYPDLDIYDENGDVTQA